MKCTYILKSGKQCTRNAQENLIYCWQHKSIVQSIEAVNAVPETKIPDIDVNANNSSGVNISTLFDKITSMDTSHYNLTIEAKNSLYKIEIYNLIQATIGNVVPNFSFTKDALDLLHNIVIYLYNQMKDLKSKEDYINYVQTTYIQDPYLAKVTDYLSVKVKALQLIKDNSTDLNTVLITNLLTEILNNVSTYTTKRYIVDYLTLNETIAHNPEIKVLLEPVIVPTKYTLLRAFYTKKIPVRVVKEVLIKYNLNMNDQAIHFIQQYIYWNYHSDNINIFGNVNLSIAEFISFWFNVITPVFKSVKPTSKFTEVKFDYKQVTDLILGHDIFEQYHKNIIKTADQYLIPELGKDVVLNVFNSYL